MTDGILMKRVMTDDVEFVVFDFAGQEVYMHTHRLFFNDQAIYVAVHDPRIGNLTELKRVSVYD